MGTGLQRSDLLSWHEQVSIKLLDWLEYIGEDKYMFSGSSAISYYTTKAPYTHAAADRQTSPTAAAFTLSRSPMRSNLENCM